MKRTFLYLVAASWVACPIAKPTVTIDVVVVLRELVDVLGVVLRVGGLEELDLGAKLALRPLDALPGRLVEALVVDLADVGDQADAQALRRLARSRRRRRARGWRGGRSWRRRGRCRSCGGRAARRRLLRLRPAGAAAGLVSAGLGAWLAAVVGAGAAADEQATVSSASTSIDARSRRRGIGNLQDRGDRCAPSIFGAAGRRTSWLAGAGCGSMPELRAPVARIGVGLTRSVAAKSGPGSH